jgi:hypothetical protein
MPEVSLTRIAMARSGDKGEGSNIGVIARSDAAFEFLQRELSVDRVQSHMQAINAGAVRRFLAPNLRLINFLLADSLGGGGSASLLTDAQGKTHGLALLRLVLDVPQAVLDATPLP